MLDEYKIQALWAEIRESEKLVEQQLEELRELISSLNSLTTQIKNADDDFNENLAVLSKLLNTANTIHNNLSALDANFDEKTADAIKLIKDNIEILQTGIHNKISEVSNDFKYAMKQNLDELRQAGNTYKNAVYNTQNEINNFISDMDKKANKKFDELNKKADKLFEDIKQKSVINRWGAVATAGLLGLLIGAGIVTYLKIDAIKDIATADLYAKKQEYQQKIDKIDSLMFKNFYSRFIEPHEIIFTIQDNKKYIAVPKNKSVKAYENDNYRIIQLSE
jgi:DNA repair exonuclease SbcCD ATPase subunit